MTSPDKIAEQLRSYLADEIDVRRVSATDGRISCVLPVQYPDGDHVVIWIEDRHDGYLVTDYGESLTDMLGDSAQDHTTLLDEAASVCRRLDLDFSKGRIVTLVSRVEIGDVVWRTATAAAQVAQISCFGRIYQLEAELERVEDVVCDLAKALCSLHAEVEMGEAIGVCLPDRVPSLQAGDVLDRHARYLPIVAFEGV